MPNSKVKAEATQSFVPIKEVRDGVIILKDGSLRALLMASSTTSPSRAATSSRRSSDNFKTFSIRSSFPCSSLFSRAISDIRPYVGLLEERYTAELDDLMKIQIREYIAFIRDFTERANIMTKNFFIVVPYDPAIISRGGAWAASAISCPAPATATAPRSPTSSSSSTAHSSSSASP